jgi:hypothetical protein
MDKSSDDRADTRRRERLVERLDQMVGSGRVTDQEAERLRAAGDPGEFDSVVVAIRARHAGAILDAAVQAASLTREEADGYLTRLRAGEHSGSLRAQLHGLRSEARSRRRLPGQPGRDDSSRKGSPA